MLVAEHLKKYYGKHRGVEDVSFTIKPGEIYGLIGPNGAGKTTTIRIILGLLYKDSGTVKIGEHDIPKELNHVKNKIGYLPGEVNFYPEMRIKEFLKFNRNFYPQIESDYEKELVEFLNIDVEKKFKELSQGNKKKVGILQALVHKPKFLIMDEPTNGLDPLLQSKLYELLEKEREKGTIILFSSHVLTEVERLCQRVGVIKEGNLIKELAMKDIRKYTRKLVTLYGLKKPEKLSGYELVNHNGREFTFSINRTELRSFLNELVNLEFDDLLIRNPSLEESFMEFYAEGVEK
ncbi:ABC transporter [Kosmotoga arenicorallina S304]|uniref:ABC transporter n=1 Tax=Kosmotoga arenicorallina S304 TaxID=1453497 RepID=A0A176JZ43_9BACT|nr:ABC transporter ATP-binding protein [Kosmotoga arenicorallina]OAA29150.1 ABC transporter [Kosmotoga arenicorallina S304]